MGVAELIPGVSGGTIAFITGIYAHLLECLRRIDGAALGVLRNSGARALWRHLDLTFLLLLFAGMATSVFLLANVVRALLEGYPVLVWSFFFGLILASALFVARRVDRWNRDAVGAAVLGLLLGVIATQLAPVELEPAPFNVFASGAVAICAWLLPGVSGSFVLLLLGMYGHLIKALAEHDLAFLALMAGGCVVGLAVFARILAWALRSFPAPTLAALTGFMLGAAAKLWPWQQVLTYYLSPEGDPVPLRSVPVTPMHFRELTGEEPLLAWALTLMVLGIAVVVLLDRLGSGHEVRGS